MITLDSVLDAAMQLPVAEKQMLIDILSKRQIEERRDEILQNANDARDAFQRGELKAERATAFIERMNTALDSDQ